MKDEHITRGSLVDMFASFNADFRQRVLDELDNSIKATEQDAHDGSAPMQDIKRSYDNLVQMRECCQEAHEEFKALNKT